MEERTSHKNRLRGLKRLIWPVILMVFILLLNLYGLPGFMFSPGDTEFKNYNLTTDKISDVTLKIDNTYILGSKQIQFNGSTYLFYLEKLQNRIDRTHNQISIVLNQVNLSNSRTVSTATVFTDIISSSKELSFYGLDYYTLSNGSLIFGTLKYVNSKYFFITFDKQGVISSEKEIFENLKEKYFNPSDLNIISNNTLVLSVGRYIKDGSITDRTLVYYSLNGTVIRELRTELEFQVLALMQKSLDADLILEIYRPGNTEIGLSRYSSNGTLLQDYGYTYEVGGGPSSTSFTLCQVITEDEVLISINIDPAISNLLYIMPLLFFAVMIIIVVKVSKRRLEFHDKVSQNKRYLGEQDETEVPAAETRQPSQEPVQ